MSVLPELRRSVVISLKAFAVLLGILALIALVGLFLSMRTNSTRYGALAVDNNNRVLTSAHKLLAAIPKPNNRSNDSLRFAAMPSFAQKWFAVALTRNGTDARLSAIILDRKTGTEAYRSRSIPMAVYDAMVEVFDRQVDGYWGETSATSDGTTLAFERKRNGRLISGVGNSPCHYAPITNYLAVGLVPYLPELRPLIQPSAESYAKSTRCNVF